MTNFIYVQVVPLLQKIRVKTPMTPKIPLLTLWIIYTTNGGYEVVRYKGVLNEGRVVR